MNELAESPPSAHATGKSRQAKNAVSSAIVWFLLCAPVLVYTRWMTGAVGAEGGFVFRRLDALVLAIIVVYCAATILLVLVAKQHAAMAVAVLYSALLALAAAEVILYFTVERPNDKLPWPPTRIVSTAAATMPGVSGERSFTINSLGIRGPEIDLGQADLRILFVGGSAVESIQVTDEASWPWLVGEQLSATARKVYCGNAGRSGHIAASHEYLLRHYRHAQSFEWVIVMCGINDMGALLRRDYAVRQAEVPETVLEGRPAGLRGPYYRSLATVRLARRYFRKAAATEPTGSWLASQRNTRKAKLALNTITNMPGGLSHALLRYRADIEGIINICRQRNQRLLFLTQPTLYRADLPEELASLLWEYCEEGAYSPGALEQTMNAFNSTLLSVCREHQVECFDVAPVLPKDATVFYDDCHFNTQGCVRLAELVSEYLRSRLAQPNTE